MNVLVACEFSGVVREEFKKLGHNAWSCDLLPTEIEGNHIQWDILEVLFWDSARSISYWDLMIAFPPCTHLARSGAKWFKEKKESGVQQEAIDFFMALVNSKIERIAIENPVGIMSTHYRKPDQIVHPWMFGEPFTKQTCLWLKNLPLLEPTNIVDKGEFSITKSGRKLPKWYNLPPSPDRGQLRGRTFKGIAEAMASQWGAL